MGITAAERMARLRARRAAERAAALRPAPGPPRVRDAGELLGPAVRETVAALRLGPECGAAAALALRYAALIDEAESPAAAVRALGPALLRVLAELRATPAARAGPARLAAAPGRAGTRIGDLRAAHAKAMARRAGG